MGKTKCCNCNKEIGMVSFKFSNTELWDISSHPKVTTMSSDDRLCSVCKKLFEEELNPEKHEDVQTNRENKTTESSKFCPNCGKEIIENASYCVGCGLDIANFNDKLKKPPQVGTLPKQEVIITKSKSWGSKFQLVMGAIVILGGAYISNPFNVFGGIVLVVIGFVSLKNKSKTVDQFLTVVSLILTGIFIINLLK